MNFNNINIYVIILIIIILFYIFNLENFEPLSSMTNILDETGTLIGQASLNNYLSGSTSILIDFTKFKTNNNISPGNTITNNIKIRNEKDILLGTAIICPPGCYFNPINRNCIINGGQTYKNYYGVNNDSIITIKN